MLCGEILICPALVPTPPPTSGAVSRTRDSPDTGHATSELTIPDRRPRIALFRARSTLARAGSYSREGAFERRGIDTRRFQRRARPRPRRRRAVALARDERIFVSDDFFVCTSMGRRDNSLDKDACASALERGEPRASAMSAKSAPADVANGVPDAEGAPNYRTSVRALSRSCRSEKQPPRDETSILPSPARALTSSRAPLTRSLPLAILPFADERRDARRPRDPDASDETHGCARSPAVPPAPPRYFPTFVLSYSKVLKESRSPRQRGRMGTSVNDRSRIDRSIGRVARLLRSPPR
jgi:hypothetical protein